MTVTYIDPPGGWKYGFPKILPNNLNSKNAVNEWLVEQGYPQKEIDIMGEYFFCRYWEEEVK